MPVVRVSSKNPKLESIKKIVTKIREDNERHRKV
jgi:endonuclease V-like protein UPF0215 family